MPRTVGVQPTVYVLAVRITTGTDTRGCTVKAINRRTGEYVADRSDTNTVSLNLADLSTGGDASGNPSGTISGFQNGDVIDVEVSGGSFGGTSHKVDTAANPGGANITIDTVDTSSTNTPGADA